MRSASTRTGSSYQRPRRGGVGYRFVWTGADGREETHDSACAGYDQATNNQMEIRAVTEALREAVAKWSPVDLSTFRKIIVFSDSAYLVNGYQSARYRWPADGWMKAEGGPVDNAELWQELLKAAHNTGKRVDVRQIPGKSSLHSKAVDKLAKASAKGHLNPPLSPTRVRRSRSSAQVSIGSVPMKGQTMTIYLRTDRLMTIQGLFRYRYEVTSGPYTGLVDDVVSERSILLSAGHEYEVVVNEDQGDPRIVEVLREVLSEDEEE